MGRPINTLKQIETTKRKINWNYGVTIMNMNDIKHNSKCIYDLMYNAFLFGYAQGVKAQKKGRAFND